jgi:hypothetical protein
LILELNIKAGFSGERKMRLKWLVFICGWSFSHHLFAGEMVNDGIRNKIATFIADNFASGCTFEEMHCAAACVLARSYIVSNGIEVSLGLKYGYDFENEAWDTLPSPEMTSSGQGISSDVRGELIRPVCAYLT